MPARMYLIILSCLFVPLGAHGATLSVPFTPQAPEANWSQPWQDACEESSIVMIDNYYQGQTTLSVSEAKAQILHTYRIKTNTFGYSLDENADTIANIINSFFSWEAYVVERPTIAQMEQEIDAGRPMILPAYGVLLKNPHYLSALLDYHVVVITGYDAETREFISNDPGTRHGVDFRYSYDTVSAAMHDYEAGNMPRSRKVAIFTSPTVTARSAGYDSDNDGLSKKEELLFGSALWLPDTDGDGYIDGRETRMGYSPTSPIKTLSRFPLIKSANQPQVYRLENGIKQHIATEQAFKRFGYRWSEIKVISDSLLSLFPEGTVLQ